MTRISGHVSFPFIIQYLLVAIKLQIETDCQKHQETSNANDDTKPELSAALPMPPAGSTPASSNIISTPQKLCHANKCQILLAKGIL